VTRPAMSPAVDTQGELDFLQHLLLGALVVAVFVAGVTASVVRGSGPTLVTAAARALFASSSAANNHLALGQTAAAGQRTLRTKVPSSWRHPKAELAVVVRCDSGMLAITIGRLSLSTPCSGHADEVLQLPSTAAGSTIVATVNEAQRTSWGLAIYR
jgi:hypothetical protein